MKFLLRKSKTMIEAQRVYIVLLFTPRKDCYGRFINDVVALLKAYLCKRRGYRSCGIYYADN